MNDRVSERVETIEVAEREAGMRLDRWFRVHFPEITHGYLQKLLRSGQVRVDARRVEGNARLETGARCACRRPRARRARAPPPPRSRRRTAPPRPTAR